MFTKTTFENQKLCKAKLGNVRKKTTVEFSKLHNIKLCK